MGEEEKEEEAEGIKVWEEEEEEKEEDAEVLNAELEVAIILGLTTYSKTASWTTRYPKRRHWHISYTGSLRSCGCRRCSAMGTLRLHRPQAQREVSTLAENFAKLLLELPIKLHLLFKLSGESCHLGL